MRRYKGFLEFLLIFLWFFSMIKFRICKIEYDFLGQSVNYIKRVYKNRLMTDR